jgi:hypothetical protein
MTIILFDYEASHDFMSSTCVERAKLTLVASGAPYVISTPGGRMNVDHIAQKVPLELSGRVFSTNLIILSGQGIDVILEMNRMKLHKAILDISGRLLDLNSLLYAKVTLHLHVVARIKASLHHLVEGKLEYIHVVQEFQDVFPDDLPGMPPDGSIEFKIELQPSTAPISMAPYLMTLVELAELTIQLQDLQDKCYIHPSSSPWGYPTLFVSKKDKDLYLYEDYRPLNAVMIKKYHLPPIGIV